MPDACHTWTVVRCAAAVWSRSEVQIVKPVMTIMMRVAMIAVYHFVYQFVMNAVVSMGMSQHVYAILAVVGGVMAMAVVMVPAVFVLLGQGGGSQWSGSA